MKTLTDRALEILKNQIEKQFGGNVSRAAEFLGIKNSTLHAWVSSEERRPSLRTLEPALERLGVSFNEPDDHHIDYAYIPLVIARAGAGSSLITDDGIEGYYAFRRDFLAQQVIFPKSSILIRVQGNSMEPTLHDGDIILVDKQEPVIVMDGKIYLVTYGDECLVKHIQKTPKGYILRSENPMYADVPVNKEDIGEAFRIHGRVRWFGRTL